MFTCQCKHHYDWTHLSWGLQYLFAWQSWYTICHFIYILHALNMNGEVIHSWSCVSTIRQATCSSRCQLKQTSGEKELNCTIPLSLHFTIYIVHLPGYLYLYSNLCWVMGVAFGMWWSSQKDDTASHIGYRPPGITALCHQSLSSCCAEQELSTHTV